MCLLWIAFIGDKAVSFVCSVNAEATERHFPLPHESRCRPCGRFHILKPFTGIFPFSSIYKPLHPSKLVKCEKSQAPQQRDLHKPYPFFFIINMCLKISHTNQGKSRKPALISCPAFLIVYWIHRRGRLWPSWAISAQLNGRACAASGRIREEGWETCGEIILMNTALPLIQKAGSLLRLRGVFVRVCARELPLLTKNCTAWDD